MRAIRRLSPLAVIATLTLAIVTSPAGATYATTGAGGAAGAATIMPTATAPDAVGNLSVVSLTWTSVAMGNGVAVAGYTVARTNNITGGTVAAGGTCAGVVTALSCNDTLVPAGTWTYSLTPVQDSWTGASSPPSDVVTTR